MKKLRKIVLWVERGSLTLQILIWLCSLGIVVSFLDFLINLHWDSLPTMFFIYHHQSLIIPFGTESIFTSWVRHILLWWSTYTHFTPILSSWFSNVNFWNIAALTDNLLRYKFSFNRMASLKVVNGLIWVLRKHLLSRSLSIFMTPINLSFKVILIVAKPLHLKVALVVTFDVWLLCQRHIILLTWAADIAHKLR